MVVVCPKCKTRLKVDEGKIKAEGSRFRCPKCRTVLLVKKPAALPKKKLDKNGMVINKIIQTRIVKNFSPSVQTIVIDAIIKMK